MMRVVDDAAVGAFERVVHAVDDDTGLTAVVAVRTTARGPAVGGTRFHAYASGACAAIDALRLADAMALKAAAAGLPVGGGKAVIAGDPRRLRCAAGRSRRAPRSHVSWPRRCGSARSRYPRRPPKPG